MLFLSGKTQNSNTMKRIFFISLIISLFLSSCTYQKKLQQLQRENDSLRNIVQQSDYTIQQYLAAFNEIQENLNTIKQKEHIITIQTSGVEGQLTEDAKEQINQDILTIYRLMQENKQKLEQLKKQMKASKIKNKELLKTIQLYEQQLQAKDREIDSLKKKLAELNINIQALNKEISQMKQQVDTLKQVTQQQQQKLQQQEIALHTAYYIVASKKDLFDYGVIDKKGILSKPILTGNFDKTHFTKIDTRETLQIPIMAKHAKILTPHPADSYELVYEGKIINYLKIKDPDKFWETTKFLVIMVK